LWRGPQAVIDNLLLPLARDWDGFSATRTNFSLATSGWFRLGFTQARFAPLGEACPLLLHIGGSCATEKSFNSRCTPIQRRCSKPLAELVPEGEETVVSDPGSRAHIAKTRVIVRTAAKRPAVLALRFFDGQVIDAGQTTAHQAILIKLPILCHRNETTGRNRRTTRRRSEPRFDSR
jgi:hypothetical protein